MARTEKAEQLARDVRSASCKQLTTELLEDMATLRETLGDITLQRQKTALDVKYVRDRQVCLGCSFCGVSEGLSFRFECSMKPLTC